MGIETNALEIAVCLRREAAGQAGGGWTLRSDGVLGKDVANDLGEVHGGDFSARAVLSSRPPA